MKKAPWIRWFTTDWIADTAHLGPLEEGIYSKLIHHYYQSRKPLPVELDKLCMIARATEPSSRYAVEVIVAEFFVLVIDPEYGEVYRHSRADKEIEWSDAQHHEAVINGALGHWMRYGSEASRKKLIALGVTPPPRRTTAPLSDFDIESSPPSGDPSSPPSGDPSSPPSGDPSSPPSGDPAGNQNQNHNQNYKRFLVKESSEVKVSSTDAEEKITGSRKIGGSAEPNRTKPQNAPKSSQAEKTKNERPEIATRSPASSPNARQPTTPLPEDWRPGKRTSAWLRGEIAGNEFLFRSIVRDFRDYWIATGQRKTLKNWDLTFRRNPFVKQAIAKNKTSSLKTVPTTRNLPTADELLAGLKR